MFELFAELLEGIVVVAIRASERAERAARIDLETIIVVHDGEPARYLAHDMTACVVMGRYVHAGESVAIPRSCRLLVEPIDRVRMRSLVEVATSWTVH